MAQRRQCLHTVQDHTDYGLTLSCDLCSAAQKHLQFLRHVSPIVFTEARISHPMPSEAGHLLKLAMAQKLRTRTSLKLLRVKVSANSCPTRWRRMKAGVFIVRRHHLVLSLYYCTTMRFFALVAAAAATLLASAASRPIYQDPTQSVGARVADLLSQMTLEEKVSVVFMLVCLVLGPLRTVDLVYVTRTSRMHDCPRRWLKC